MESYLEVNPEVKQALHEGKPVVALESTIISHGMPYPQNVETALFVEETIRKGGAIPATIAIIEGKLKAGLDEGEIQLLGKKGNEVLKVSRRDMPFVLAKGMDGATTVASTMIVAALAGISIFATGGIGGVHKGASETFDISADLQELAKTNVAVICAGAKSILDLNLTLEYLETFGVPVIGFQTEEFPAFFTRKSGLRVDYRIDEVDEMAKILKMKWGLGLQGGVVIANPVPEEYQMAYQPINQAINQAIAESKAKGIMGKAVTPYLLAKIEELTGGASLEANIRLVLNNAKLATHLANAYSKMIKIH